MGRHRRRMKREEIRELKAFPIQLGTMPTPDDAWFSIDPALDARGDRDDNADPVEDEDEQAPADDEPPGALSVGEAGPVAEGRGRVGEGQAPVVL